MDIFIFLICCCCCCCISLLGGGFYFYTQYKLPSNEKEDTEEYIKKLQIYAEEEMEILTVKAPLCRENNNKSCWDEIKKNINDLYEKFMKDIGEKKGIKINIKEKIDKIKPDDNGMLINVTELYTLIKICREVVKKYIEKYALEEEKILIQKYNKSVDLGDSCKEKNHPCWDEMKMLINNFYLEFLEFSLGINKDDKTYGNKSYGDDIGKDLKPDKKMDENDALVPKIKKMILGDLSYGSKQ